MPRTVKAKVGRSGENNYHFTVFSGDRPRPNEKEEDVLVECFLEGVVNVIAPYNEYRWKSTTYENNPEYEDSVYVWGSEANTVAKRRENDLRAEIFATF